MQSPTWGLAKRDRRVEPRAFAVDEAPPVLVLVYHHADGNSHGYVPWGPQPGLPQQTGAYLEDLARSLQPLLPRQCLYLRFDLPWRDPWDGEPEQPSLATRELEINFGTKEHRLRKAPTDVQPTYTSVVDLSISEEERLARMKAKTRYNVRLARRRGVQVRAASPREMDRWVRMYHATMERHGKTRHEGRHFRRLFEAARRAPRAATIPGAPPRKHNLRLMMARLHGRALAGMILAVSDDYAVYLYGASSGADRRSMPAYLLQWEAMRAARRLGARRYDLFGLAPDRRAGHPLSGLRRFKEGFGGHELARRGCWDFPFDLERYQVIVGREAADAGFHNRGGQS